ncbi:MAG: hypothetical protein HY290_21495 [Planctomycetia bacterium]|nr:hypothetical protein [Planctomycetia bacterium]
MTDGVLAVIGVACTALCTWLTVRIINRRERWAKRVAMSLIATLAYPMSLWPACWLVQHGVVPPRIAAAAYDPLFWLEFRAPQSVQEATLRWAKSLRVEAIYVGLRDTPFQRSYPVGDFAFRWQDGRRVFAADPWLLDSFWTTIEPDSWEELSRRIGMATN